jgi:large subunit ribosomal protein L15
MMHLGDLRPAQGAKKRRKRVGRGMSSGHGKTSTRGMKGQKARYSVRPGFEGGQTPLYRRLRKRRGMGKSARNLGIFRRNYAEVNVGRLDARFDAGTVVTPELLQQQGLVRGTIDGLRVLGQGQLTKSLTIRAHHFSASARAKIEAVGGTAEVI